MRSVREERNWADHLSSNITKIREVTRNGKTYQQDVSRIGKNEDGPAQPTDGRVALPSLERSLKKLFAIVQKANEAVREINETVASGSKVPMLPADQIEVITAVRDGLDKLIRWKTQPPLEFELAELRRAVMLEQESRKPADVQESPAEQVA